MFSIHSDLRPFLTKQSTFLASLWAFVAIMGGSIVLIFIVMGVELGAASLLGGTERVQGFVDWLYVFSTIGLLSFLFGWLVVLGLALCHFILRRLRFDGLLPMMLCGMAMTWAFSLFLSPVLVDVFSDDGIGAAVTTQLLICGAIYGFAYALFLRWLCVRKRNGTLHGLT